MFKGRVFLGRFVPSTCIWACVRACVGGVGGVGCVCVVCPGVGGYLGAVWTRGGPPLGGGGVNVCVWRRRRAPAVLCLSGRIFCLDLGGSYLFFQQLCVWAAVGL